MTCPNCNIKLDCPCKSCQKTRKKNGQISALIWEMFDSEIAMCPICGFKQHLDFWETYDFYLWKLSRGEIVPDVNDYLSRVIDKWRDENQWNSTKNEKAVPNGDIQFEEK